MIRRFKTIGSLAVLALATGGSPTEFSIERHTMDAGGGTSSGGGFELSGTIGQPDAADPSIPENITLAGGFWNGFLLVGPDLSIEFLAASAEVRLSWPLPDDGFVLEENSLLQATGNVWFTIPPGSYQSDGNERFVLLSNLEPGIRIFRLNRPPAP